MACRVWGVAFFLLLGPSCVVAQQKATRMTTYVDPETGVTVRYPSAWTAEKSMLYGADPLVVNTEKNPHPAQTRLGVGWDVPSLAAKDEAASVASSTFRYVVMREKTAAACAAAMNDWDEQGKPEDVVIHGTPFHHWSYSDAGLGHSWSFELYTTFRKGRCLGFSVGNEMSHPDEIKPFSAADQKVPSDANAIFRSLHFATSSKP